MQANTITGWVIKGLGGAANMVASFAAEKIPLDNQQLKDLRAVVVQLASHYNWHAKRSSMEEVERPPLFASDYPIGETTDNGRLEATQPASQVAASESAAGDEPTDADNRPGVDAETGSGN